MAVAVAAVITQVECRHWRIRICGMTASVVIRMLKTVKRSEAFISATAPAVSPYMSRNSTVDILTDYQRSCNVGTFR